MRNTQMFYRVSCMIIYLSVSRSKVHTQRGEPKTQAKRVLRTASSSEPTRKLGNRGIALVCGRAFMLMNQRKMFSSLPRRYCPLSQSMPTPAPAAMSLGDAGHQQCRVCCAANASRAQHRGAIWRDLKQTPPAQLHAAGRNLSHHHSAKMSLVTHQTLASQRPDPHFRSRAQQAGQCQKTMLLIFWQQSYPVDMRAVFVASLRFGEVEEKGDK